MELQECPSRKAWAAATASRLETPSSPPFGIFWLLCCYWYSYTLLQGSSAPSPTPSPKNITTSRRQRGSEFGPLCATFFAPMLKLWRCTLIRKALPLALPNSCSTPQHSHKITQLLCAPSAPLHALNTSRYLSTISPFQVGEGSCRCTGRFSILLKELLKRWTEGK